MQPALLNINLRNQSFIPEIWCVQTCIFYWRRWMILTLLPQQIINNHSLVIWDIEPFIKCWSTMGVYWHTRVVSAQRQGRQTPGETYSEKRDLLLQWRHDERDGPSNHRRLDYLPNRLFRRRSRKTSKLHVTAWPLWREFIRERWIPPRRGPVTRKMFPFDDVIMWCQLYRHLSHRRLSLWLA